MGCPSAKLSRRPQRKFLTDPIPREYRMQPSEIVPHDSDIINFLGYGSLMVNIDEKKKRERQRLAVEVLETINENHGGYKKTLMGLTCLTSYTGTDETRYTGFYHIPVAVLVSHDRRTVTISTYQHPNMADVLYGRAINKMMGEISETLSNRSDT